MGFRVVLGSAEMQSGSLEVAIQWEIRGPRSGSPLVTLKLPTPGFQFCASRAYEGSRADELSVPAGAHVHVLEMSDRGWWLCRYAGVGALWAVGMGV